MKDYEQNCINSCSKLLDNVVHGIDISKMTFDAVLFMNDLQKKSPHAKF